MVLDQQELINAACLFGAREFNTIPDNIEVELFYDDEWSSPFGAELYFDGRELEIDTPKLIAGIRMYLDQYTDVDPMAASIDLQMDEDGIFYANIDE